MQFVKNLIVLCLRPQHFSSYISFLLIRISFYVLRAIKYRLQDYIMSLFYFSSLHHYLCVESFFSSANDCQI